MEILKFKTNVATQADVTSVTPALDQLEKVENWRFDTETENNILSVSGSGVDPQKVENALSEVGFNAELIRVLGIGGEAL
ncbi:copper chaperone [Rufibacter immobilis]|uniref:Copper chaperone n=1 Tax=Rufibacter immobilis TaxID=1348778 RepID=A0A3M9MTV8_9BACT|nr:copper chaperone [Rufibacter immobilis]RNI28168.1 copper chaperone [Rufibacter immobilis]